MPAQDTASAWAEVNHDAMGEDGRGRGWTGEENRQGDGEGSLTGESDGPGVRGCIVCLFGAGAGARARGVSGGRVPRVGRVGRSGQEWARCRRISPSAAFPPPLLILPASPRSPTNSRPPNSRPHFLPSSATASALYRYSKIASQNLPYIFWYVSHLFSRPL